MSIGRVGNRQKKLMIILVLVSLILAVYWQVWKFNFINFDDDLYVTQNHSTQAGLSCTSVFHAFTDTGTANWHPLTMLSHALDWELFGNGAGGHHWTNLIFHILNSVMLFLLLNAMTGAIWRSALVAALFAVHPINVESVAWVAERKNVLSTFFWLLTILFYVWYVKKPDWKRYLPVLISFALGLMSKAMLVTLPFVLLLLDYWPLNRTAIDTQINPEVQSSLKSRKVKSSFLILEKIPLFILTAASIVLALYMQRAVGAVVSTDSLPIHVRVMNAIISYGLYIKKMFLPFDLSIFYPLYNIDIGRLVIVSFALLFVSVISVRQYRKRPYLIIGWLWFLGTLVPVLGLVQVGVQSMADRYAYVPLIGLFIMMVWYARDLALNSKYIKLGLILISTILILGLSVVAWQRCHLWGDQVALWNDVLKNHKVAFAYNLRGLSHAKKGQYDLALADYNAAIALDKKFAAVLNNRGILNVLRGEKMKGLDDYDRAIHLNPRFADAYYNRALLHLESGKLAAAIDDFSTAVDIDPGNADYLNYRGVALRLEGQYERSFADFNQALKLNENFAEAYFNRGLIYLMQKQNVAAVVDFTHALRIKSDYIDARLNRGIVFASLGKYDQAVKDFSNVLRLDSRHVPALKNLGIVLKRMKRYEESYIQFQKCIQIDPDDSEALKYLREIENLKKKP